MLFLKNAKSFLRAVWSFVRYGDVPLWQGAEREETCLACPELKLTQTGMFCKKCRCPHWPLSDLRTKWRMRDVGCPLDKWKRRIVVRAKFRVQYVQDFGASKKVYLVPVTDDGIAENARFHKYTPSGSLEMVIDNPPAADQFKPQMDFYVDFTPVEKAAE
jgi:hypothetical protein